MDDATTTPTGRVDTALRALRQAIIEQALLPGTKLPEDELGRHFGMSRTLVRAMLSRLQAQGLVNTPPKRTATVALPSLEEARDAFELRRVLEAEVVRRVIKTWTTKALVSLERHVDEERTAFLAGQGRVSTRLAGEFHLKLAELSGSALLQRYLSELVSRCSLILAAYGRPHSAECAISEHSGLIEALRAGDPESATALMDAHLGAVERRAMLSDGAGETRDLGAILELYTAGAAAGKIRHNGAAKHARRQPKPGVRKDGPSLKARSPTGQGN